MAEIATTRCPSPPGLPVSEAYVVGQILVKDAAKWDEYRNRVPATLEPWGAKLVFRGTQVAVMAGECTHPDIVVIRFPTTAAAQAWFSSAAYQALIPMRLEAADVTLLSYAT
jgi:uncharacterized protein (DUF1330 family)